ncbi:MAG: heme ABC exporter ATP-binding protein CcmA [Gemmatimonadaceae bacterium]
MSVPAPTVEVTALRKEFGRRAAVSGVDFTLSGGDCLALFGPNGAGKTTLLRLIAGLLKPTAGSTRVRGVDVRRDGAARAAVGLISHQSMLYAPFTPRENVEFTARLYGLRGADARSAATAALDAMLVLDRADVPLRTLSRGLQQRVSVARAIVHGPAVLLLDEPFSGLDESGARALTELLSSLLGKGATMIVVTHNVAEGLTLATHAAIMKDGGFARFDRRTGASFDAPRYAADYRELVRHAS